MTQSNVIPLFGAFVFEHHFEECPLFRAGIWRAGTIDGVFEVSYDFGDRDWYISDIAVCADNGKLGAEAQGKTISLNCDEHAHIYATLLDALSDRYSTYIEERIADEMADRGYSIAA